MKISKNYLLQDSTKFFEKLREISGIECTDYAFKSFLDKMKYSRQTTYMVNAAVLLTFLSKEKKINRGDLFVSWNRLQDLNIETVELMCLYLERSTRNYNFEKIFFYNYEVPSYKVSFSFIENKYGVSLEDISEKIGIPAKHLRSIEDGKIEPDFETLFKVSTLLGIKVDELIAIKYIKERVADKFRDLEQEKKE